MHTWGRKPKHVVRTLVSISVALIFVVILLINLYKNLDSLQAQHVTFAPVQFGVSLVPLVFSYFFIPSMWCRILASLGLSLSYRKAFCIQYLAHLGRYIPGKIWSYVTQSYLASQEHVSLVETLCSNLVLMCLMNLGSLLVFALSFLAWNIFTFFTRFLLVSLSFLLIYFLFRMHVLERGINVILARFTNTQIMLRYDHLHYAPLIGAISLSWLTFAVGLHIMVTSFYAVDMRQSCIIVGIFSISWLAGYYAFLSPGGLGVQEGVQVYLLTFFLPLPISIVIAFASRLWTLLGDLILFLLAVALTMHENRLQRSTRGLYF